MLVEELKGAEHRNIIISNKDLIYYKIFLTHNQ